MECSWTRIRIPTHRLTAVMALLEPILGEAALVNVGPSPGHSGLVYEAAPWGGEAALQPLRLAGVPFRLDCEGRAGVYTPRAMWHCKERGVALDCVGVDRPAMPLDDGLSNDSDLVAIFQRFRAELNVARQIEQLIATETPDAAVPPATPPLPPDALLDGLILRVDSTADFVPTDEARTDLRSLCRIAKLLYVACDQLLTTIDTTGGVVEDEHGYVAPALDPEWIDLGEAYESASAALKEIEKLPVE